jgi:hypothetical protein
VDEADLLGRGVLDELNTLGNVALEAVVASLEQLLLVLVGAADNINGPLGTTGLVSTLAMTILRIAMCSTYAKLDGDGEELGASGLGDGITALNTGKVDEAGLDNTLLALGGLDDLLGEAARC